MDEKVALMIIEDHRNEGLGYRILADKYGMSRKQIHRIVMSKVSKKTERPEPGEKPVIREEAAFPDDMEALQEELRHSDRGSQYCADEYVCLLKTNAIGISMTQSGDPRDNAIAERVNGILKQELLLEAYPNIKRAHRSVVAAVDIYNRIRPHSSLDMMTPEKAHARTGPIRQRWKSWAERQPAL